MILSNFNFLYKLKNSDNYIFYNCLMNSLVIIDEKEHRDITENRMSDDLKQKLIDLGFVVKSFESERKIIEDRINESKHSNTEFNLTIASTLNCNFRCSYCYEKSQIRNIPMTLEVEKKLYAYVRSEHKKLKFNNLNIMWYGGELLLNIKSIDRLSRLFIGFCEKNNVKYSAGIITNGYLLTRKRLLKLLDLNISFIQITLDGDKYTHDERRKLADGSGSFDVILNNLKYNYDIYDYLVIRVNVDKENFGSYKDVKKMIGTFDKQKKIYVYPGYVTNSNDSYCSMKCCSKKEFSKLVVEDMRGTVPRLPQLMGAVCSAACKNSYVVDGGGNFYKCWNEIGMLDKVIKNLDREFNTGLEFKYLSHTAINDSKCSKCKILPICLGGCIYHFGETENCSEYLYILEENVRLFVKYHFGIN